MCKIYDYSYKTKITPGSQIVYVTICHYTEKMLTPQWNAFKKSTKVLFIDPASSISNKHKCNLKYYILKYIEIFRVHGSTVYNFANDRKRQKYICIHFLVNECCDFKTLMTCRLRTKKSKHHQVRLFGIYTHLTELHLPMKWKSKCC